MPAIRKMLPLLAALLLGVGWGAHGHAEGLPPADDLRDLDPENPVILAFTADDCPYCEFVKDSHLIPMHRRGEEVTIREVDVGSHRELTTFEGEALEHRDLGGEYDIQVTPTLVFLTPKGESKADNLVGVSSQDYYGSYLDRRIENVRESMAEE